jgi:hypothetical protein
MDSVDSVWWTDLLWAMAAAAIVGLIVWLFKRPREYLTEFWRAGRNKPFSRLHVVLGSHFPPNWMRVDTAGGPKMAWQCELTITNGGNRPDAPARGELRWNGRTTTFLTALTRRNQLIADGALEPGESAPLLMSAWTDLRDSEDPASDQRTVLRLFDRYGGSFQLRVTFPPVHRVVVQLGECRVTTVRDNRTVFCDQPEGHEGQHSALDPATSIATTWGDDDDAPGGDFLVIQ